MRVVLTQVKLGQQEEYMSCQLHMSFQQLGSEMAEGTEVED